MGGDAAAGAADDSERHQPAALRDAQGHHGGEEEGDPQGRAAGAGRAARSGSSALYVPEKIEEDADDRRLAGRSREGARAAAARRSAGDPDDSRRRRTARRQAQSRDVGSRSRRRSSWPAATPITVAVAGRGVGARGRASWPRPTVAEVDRRRRTPRSSRYTPDGYVAGAAAGRSRSWRRRIVLLPHTYQTRDFAPTLAARLDRALVTDVTGDQGRRTAQPRSSRPMFQGKLTADVVPQGPAPHFVTFQIGAFRADQRRAGARRPRRSRALARRRRRRARSARSPRRRSRKRSRPSTCRRPSASSSVGRGIKEQEQHRARAAAGRGARRRARRLASDLRRRLAADGAPGRQLRARPSRRSCTSRSASPARFSTSSA